MAGLSVFVPQIYDMYDMTSAVAGAWYLIQRE
jgi:hypothetical protein